MDEKARQWRPALAMRLACGVNAVLCFVLAAATVAAQAADGRADPVLAAGFVAACIAGFIPLRYALKCQIMLAGGGLTVANLWQTHRFPVGLVVEGRPTRSGIEFVLGDGRRCLASAVQTGRWQLWMGETTPADRVVSAVLAAAEQARAGGEPVAFPAPGDRTGSAVAQRRAWLTASVGIAVLAVSASLYLGLHHRRTSSQEAAHTAPAPAMLKVGACLEDPTSPQGSLVPVTCSTPHTAQVYFLTDTADAAGVTCANGSPNLGTPPVASSYEQLTYSSGGSSTTACLVITPPINYSLILRTSPSP